MVNVTITLYSFDELNEKAQKLAVQEHEAFLLSIGVETENAKGEMEIIYTDTIEHVEVIDNIKANDYLFYADGKLASVTTYTDKHPRSGQSELDFHGETLQLPKQVEEITYENYKNALAALQAVSREQINKFNSSIAKRLRRYKKGDIVQQFDNTIRIDSFKYYAEQGTLPRPVYIGALLKKDLTARKDASIGNIYGNENVTLIKEA